MILDAGSVHKATCCLALCQRRAAIKIRNIALKNSIAIPPMVCFHWTDDNGYMTEKNIRHYTDLAEGGAGLIIVEATAITKRSRLHNTELGL